MIVKKNFEIKVKTFEKKENYQNIADEYPYFELKNVTAKAVRTGTIQ